MLARLDRRQLRCMLRLERRAVLGEPLHRRHRRARVLPLQMLEDERLVAPDRIAVPGRGLVSDTLNGVTLGCVMGEQSLAVPSEGAPDLRLCLLVRCQSSLVHRLDRRTEMLAN